jgi:membrane associated rhomboid family serine protease
VQGHPVYATTFLIGLFVASALVVALLDGYIHGHPLDSDGAEAFLDFLTFSSRDVIHGKVWKIVTYPLVNHPTINFAISMLMLWWFGREIERFFGRKLFFRFYAIAVLIPAVLFTIVGATHNIPLAGEPGSVAVFLAFATLYPNALLIFNILAKWFAFAYVGIITLICLADNDLIQLTLLWCNVGLGYVFVRYEQGRITLPSFSFRRLLGMRKRPKLRVVRREDAESEPSFPQQSASMNEIDPLLDKIARSGLASLTAEEKERLEKARQEMLKRDR